MNLNSSIPLVKELVAKQISQKSHIKKIDARSKNSKYEPGKQKTQLKNIQSPFGDFPKDYTKNLKTSKENKNRLPEYANSYGRSEGLVSFKMNTNSLGTFL